MIQHDSLYIQLASATPNKFNILLHKISKSPAKRSMDQLCNANTRNKARGGISGVYHHYTQQRPSKWNEFPESIQCLPLGESGQAALKRPLQAGQDGWFTRRSVLALIDQAGSLARGVRSLARQTLLVFLHCATSQHNFSALFVSSKN